MLLVQKADFIERLHKQEKRIEELEEHQVEHLKTISDLRDQAVTEEQKMSKFKELLECKMSDLKQQLICDIKSTVANK